MIRFPTHLRDHGNWSPTQFGFQNNLKWLPWQLITNPKSWPWQQIFNQYLCIMCIFLSQLWTPHAARCNRQRNYKISSTQVEKPRQSVHNASILVGNLLLWSRLWVGDLLPWKPNWVGDQFPWSWRWVGNLITKSHKFEILKSLEHFWNFSSMYYWSVWQTLYVEWFS